MKRAENAYSYLLEWSKPYKLGYISSIVYAIIGVFFGIIPYYAISKIVYLLFEGDKVIANYQSWFILMFLGFTGQLIFHNISTYISHNRTFKVIADVRQNMCDKLLKVPMGTILSTNSGEMKNLMVEKVDSIEPTLAHLVPEFTSKLSIPVVIWMYIMSIDWKIGLISLISIPIGIIAYMCMMIGYEKGFSRYTKANKNLNAVAVEYINAIDVIKAFNNSAKSYKKFSDAVYESAHSAIDWMKSNQLFFAIGMTIIPATLLTTLPAATYYYLQESIVISEFITIIVLSLGMTTPLIGAMSMSDDIAQIGTIVGDIVSVLEQEELIRPDREVNITNHDISLKDVSFGYNEREVLHDINLEFKEGEVTALVGASGGGKSTITKLIASMWEVEKGEIKIGNTNIKDISLKQLNQIIAYVSQDNFLFDESIMENIRKGNLDATDEQVISIAKKSGCHEFISSLSNGYQTIVGGSGAHLSGGERQRIAIARAMLKDAPIIILDEATAYTDPENEAIIQKSVSKLVKDKTLIIVAHRLSTITDSDKIILVDKGCVSATGTHDYLMKNSKLYKELFDTHMGVKDEKEA